MGKPYVKIDGKPYYVQPGTGRRGLASNYVQRVNTTGADTEADLAPPFSRWTQEDWSGGSELRLAGREGTRGFLQGYGIDPSWPGELRRGYGVTLANTFAENGVKLIRWRNGLFAYSESSGKIYRYDGVSWSQIANPAVSSIGAAVVGDNYIYFGSGSSGQVWRYDGGTFEAWGAAISELAGGITGLAWYNSTLYVGGQTGTGRFRIGTWTGTSDQTGWTKKFEADGALTAMLVRGSVIEFASKYVSNGNQGFHWRYDGSSVSNPGFWPDNYPTMLLDFSGLLLLGMAQYGSVWQWDGQAYTEVLHLDTPDRPYTQPIESGVRYQTWTAIAYQNPLDGAGLLYFDAEKPWPGPSGGPAGKAANSVTVYQGTAWFAVRETGAAKLYRVNTTRRGTGLIELAEIDVALPGIFKEWARVAVSYVKPLQAGDSVRVEYDADGSGVWSLLGEDSVEGATSSLFTFPLDEFSRRLKLRVRLTGSSAEGTPVPRSVTVDYLPSPDVKERYGVTLNLHDDVEYEDGTIETRSSVQQYQDLLALRRSRKRFLFEWFDNSTIILATWPDQNSVGLNGQPISGGWLAKVEGGLAEDENPRYLVPVEVVEVSTLELGTVERYELLGYTVDQLAYLVDQANLL